MLTANDANGKKIVGYEICPHKTAAYCPACGSDLVLKCGKKVISHFAHKPDSVCSFSTPESYRHLSVKKAIYESLKSDSRVAKLELERYLGEVRPDISGYLNGYRVAIEVQNSDISINTIKKRYQWYSSHGIGMVWVLTSPLPAVLDEYRRDNCVRLKDWQLYLYYTFGKNLFYHIDGSKVKACKFKHWVSYYEGGDQWDDREVELQYTGCLGNKGDYDLLDFTPSWQDFVVNRFGEFPPGWLFLPPDQKSSNGI